MGKYLDQSGLSHLWGKIKSYFRIGNFYRLQTKTYTGVIATENADPAGYLYYAKVLPEDYGTEWHAIFKVSCTVAGISTANGSGKQESYVYYHGRTNVILNYTIYNNTSHTSYRGYYQHVVYRGTQTGINAGYGHALGLRLQSSYNPATAANSRTVDIEVLWTKNCTISFLDSMVVYASLPGTGSTNYTARNVYEAVTQGLTTSGDKNNFASYIAAFRGYTIPIGASGLRQYGIILRDGSGSYQSLTTNSGSGTSKTRNTAGFRLGEMYYLNSGSNFTTGADLNGVELRNQQYSLDLRYSTNCGSTLTLYRPVYLVGTMSGGLFYLDSTWWTQTEPSSDDGKVYIPVGMAISAYQVDFSGWQGAYWYKNGSFRQMVLSAQTSEAVSDKLDSGSGIEFSLDSNGKGQYRAVGASAWIPFLTGGADASIVGFFWGRTTSNSYANVSWSFSIPDNNYITVDGAEITFITAGTYTINTCGRGGYNTSGTASRLYFRIYQNGTSIIEKTAIGNGGGYYTNTITVAVGDVLKVQMHTQNSNTSDMALAIVRSTS